MNAQNSVLSKTNTCYIAFRKSVDWVVILFHNVFVALNGIQVSLTCNNVFDAMGTNPVLWAKCVIIDKSTSRCSTLSLVLVSMSWVRWPKIQRAIAPWMSQPSVLDPAALDTSQ